MKVFILGGVLLIGGAITVFAVRQRYDDTAFKLWFAGVRKPFARHLKALAEHFGVTLDELVKESE